MSAESLTLEYFDINWASVHCFEYHKISPLPQKKVPPEISTMCSDLSEGLIYCKYLIFDVLLLYTLSRKRKHNLKT